MGTPRIDAPELVVGQSVPETTVNEIARYLEAGGGSFFNCLSKGTTAPPGSPTDGVVLIVGAAATGDWTGFASGCLALYIEDHWVEIPAHEGAFAYDQALDRLLMNDGSGGIAAWVIFREAATNAQIWAGSENVRPLTPANLYTSSAPVALTSGATVTPDGNNGFNFTLTIAHNATLANASNFKVGQSGLIVITQGTGEPWTLAYGTNWKFPGGAPVLSTAAGAVDLLTYYVVTSSLYVCTLTKAYSS